MELLKRCSNLSIDHTDDTANTLQVLDSLLKDSRIRWYQQVEGKITEGLQFNLDENGKAENLLSKKGNTIAYWQADYRNIRPQFTGYDIIIADIRQKNSGSEIVHLAGRLQVGGLLILGSIDNTFDVQVNENHCIASLRKYFTRVSQEAEEYPHIYHETRNKHQYAISHYSVWKKITVAAAEEEENEKEESNAKEEVIPSSNVVSSTTSYYEDKNILASYDSFHFGEGFLSVKNFSLQMSEVILEACTKFECPLKKALDAGCGPGRVAIELCSTFERVSS